MSDLPVFTRTADDEIAALKEQVRQLEEWKRQASIVLDQCEIKGGLGQDKSALVLKHIEKLQKEG